MEEKEVAKYLENKGFRTFVEPFSTKEPDVLAFKKEDNKIVLIEVKDAFSVDAHTIAQVRDYTLKLKPIFEEFGFETEVWLVGVSTCASWHKKELDEYGVKIFFKDELTKL